MVKEPLMRGSILIGRSYLTINFPLRTKRVGVPRHIAKLMTSKKGLSKSIKKPNYCLIWVDTGAMKL